MQIQVSFDFSAPPPPPADDEVSTLVHYLHSNPGFHTARQLSAVLGLTDRKIRQITEAADGLITSGPGSPGYCHLAHCPVELLAHINDGLISQAKRMIRRAIRSNRRAHTLIR